MHGLTQVGCDAETMHRTRMVYTPLVVALVCCSCVSVCDREVLEAQFLQYSVHWSLLACLIRIADLSAESKLGASHPSRGLQRTAGWREGVVDAYAGESTRRTKASGYLLGDSLSRIDHQLC